MLYMITFTINIPQMLAYIPAPWILWDILYLHFFGGFPENHRGYRPGSIVMWRPGSIDERVGFFWVFQGGKCVNISIVGIR